MNNLSLCLCLSLFLSDSLTSLPTIPAVTMSIDSNIRSDTPSTSDELGGYTRKQKSVAIDITQNELFSHRLLPSQSPEFDNVMNQVYFSLPQYIPVYSSIFCSTL